MEGQVFGEHKEDKPSYDIIRSQYNIPGIIKKVENQEKAS